MKRVGIIQARMTSTRLPGKVLLPLLGRPMLAQQLRRLREAKRLDELVVATTTNASDDAIVALCRSENVRWFRGSEHDVLERYTLAARDARAELVVRLTSDCPLIDPEIVDRVVALAEEAPRDCDYASNTLQRTYPRGLDNEALFSDVLERAHRSASSRPAREHVTYHVYAEAAAQHRIRQLCESDDQSDLRWTVDTPEDFSLIERLFELSGADARVVKYRELLGIMQAHPELRAINAAVQQKAP